MKAILSVAAVLAAAGGAQAAFDLAAVDFGAALGTPITASAPFVQAAADVGDLGTPGLEFGGTENSSSLWMSGTGITEQVGVPAPGFVTTSGGIPDLAANSGGGNDVIIGDTLAGGWLVQPDNPNTGVGFETAGDNGLLGDDQGFGSVLIARLSVPTGASINFGDAFGSVTVTPTGDGDDNVSFDANFNTPVSAAGSAFQLVAVSRGSGVLEGTSIDTYDIFVNEVPTPGAVTLAGLAGLAGLRRRR